MKPSFYRSISSEDLPSDESVVSSKPEEHLLDRPNSISDDSSESSYFSSSSSSDDDSVISERFNDQINLAEEFNNFAAAIIREDLASIQNVNLWIDLSDQVSPDFYLESFTPNEICDLITLFLNEIRKNTYYKYPCLAILVKWVLNLRRPFFDAFGFNIFGYSPIAQVFENEYKVNPNNELLLAINMLRMPMI